MKILMMTNTYAPIVGGLEKSIQSFTRSFRDKGYTVKIVVPQYEGSPKDEFDVIRIPGIQKFNGTDFSVGLPVPGLLEGLFESFQPDIIHAHHPFLVGDLALRLSGQYKIPLVFTHHTLFEQYTSYFALDHASVQAFVNELAVGYANLASYVITPSQSVKSILRKRGVEAPISVVPTGMDMARFKKGTGTRNRKKRGIPERAFTVGYSGRLSAEKNLQFLAEVMSVFLAMNEKAHFLIAGDGPLRKEMESIFKKSGVSRRVHMAGVLKGNDLVDVYHAMDVFVFASKSETQGMVVTEAMAAGIPVIALKAPGVREVVRDQKNGRLLSEESVAPWVKALNEFSALNSEQYKRFSEEALKTAEKFSEERCAAKALKVYQKALGTSPISRAKHISSWETIMGRIKTEWKMLQKLSRAASAAVKETVLT